MDLCKYIIITPELSEANFSFTDSTPPPTPQLNYRSQLLGKIYVCAHVILLFIFQNIPFLPSQWLILRLYLPLIGQRDVSSVFIGPLSVTYKPP